MQQHSRGTPEKNLLTWASDAATSVAIVAPRCCDAVGTTVVDGGSEYEGDGRGGDAGAAGAAEGTWSAGACATAGVVAAGAEAPQPIFRALYYNRGF